MLHGIDACLWPAVGWNALHNRLQVRRAYSNERVHWLSCNILIVLQRCDVSIADLVRRVRRIHITEFQFTLVNIFCLSMHDQHSTQEYAPLCEDHFVITIGGFDVLFRMFNNTLKLCLLLLLLLSLLLSYSVVVVIYICLLQTRSGEDRAAIPWRTTTQVLDLNRHAAFCHFANFGTRMSATDVSTVDVTGG